MNYVIVTQSPQETGQAGFQIGEAIQPSTVLALQGPPGGGKTCFVQGIARGMGILDDIVSPTYTLAIPYSGRMRLLHVDAYRIHDSEELVELGLMEELDSGAVLAIEWFDRFKNDFPLADLIITFADGDSEFERKIQVDSGSDLGQEIVANLPPVKD